jgi:hypothetical protein
MRIGYWWESQKERHKLGRPRCRRVDKLGWDSMDWIDMAQDRDQWRALVNTVMNLQVP